MGGASIPSKAKEKLNVGYVPPVDCSAALKSIKKGYPTKYKEHFPELLVEIMSNGDGVCHFCAAAGIHYDTFYDWLKKKPIFSEAYKIAKMHCMCWWQNASKKGLSAGKDFNTAVYYINMKNRFDWNDRKASYPKVELPGFKGSIKDKSAATNKALKAGLITADHHNMIMSSLMNETQIMKADDQEKRLAEIERQLSK